ncbi:serine protease [Aliiglaciecola sp. LCG003]|uniref:S1 family peptidase n=1 Tax=Aliiglaciecola sp. LCG003 TaxID=3053655 RepID=UPI0025745341|nr:serine protease [Aliiglaciecola sp. LCG003]WJG08459.1 serine protease [Aliiglaciecola sp. LCG003]
MSKFSYLAIGFLVLLCAPNLSLAHSIVDTVKKVKESVVGIGVFDPINSPRASLQGTGFAVADGSYIITNHHVISTPLKENSRQKRVVFVGTGRQPKALEATVVEIDELHDLALLKISEKLKPMQLADNNLLDDGTEVAFTGFPIGAILGHYPVTHKGIMAASTPIIIPSSHSSQLDVNTLRRLRDPYYIYQMDATAYPGNSGSAVYEVDQGKVVAVINKVFVKTTKEAVLSEPSGITYAIPVKYVRELLKQAKVSLK